MRVSPLSRKALTAAAAVAVVGSTVFGVAGTASAAPAARPTTEMLIQLYTPLSATTFKLPGRLIVQSSGKAISGAVVQLLRGGTNTGRSATTNANGNVSFNVTVAKGDHAHFQLKFPGNNSFVMDTSPSETVPEQ